MTLRVLSAPTKRSEIRGELYTVEIKFAGISARVRTARGLHGSLFRLPVEVVDDLRAAAREIMTSSKDFQAFMRDVDGHWSPPVKNCGLAGDCRHGHRSVTRMFQARWGPPSLKDSEAPLMQCASIAHCDVILR